MSNYTRFVAGLFIAVTGAQLMVGVEWENLRLTVGAGLLLVGIAITAETRKS